MVLLHNIGAIIHSGASFRCIMNNIGAAIIYKLAVFDRALKDSASYLDHVYLFVWRVSPRGRVTAVLDWYLLLLIWCFCIHLVSFALLRRVTFFLQLKKVTKKSRHYAGRPCKKHRGSH